MQTRQRETAVPLPAVLGLNREQSAAFVGISPSLFDKMIEAGKMPHPRLMFGRNVWDVDELVISFKAIPHKIEEMAETINEEQSQGNAWDNARKAG